MNVMGYLLLMSNTGEFLIRKTQKSYPVNGNKSPLTAILACLSIAALGYTLISALNARATYHPDQWRFEYHSYVSWLPHSYDRTNTWRLFWDYLGLAGFFWGIRNWLQNGRPSTDNIPSRVRILLWVLSINGALLAAEAIVQRAMGTNKLLFFQETRINRLAEAQLGPFAYRSNGAQYLNLIWPMTLALWGVARHKFRRNYQHLLLPCAMLMIVAPVLSLSRGGALIAIGQMFLCTLFLVAARREMHWGIKIGLSFLFLLMAGFGVLIGGPELNKRMENLDRGFAGREEISDIGRKVIADYPFLGTGPGSMDAIYNLYRGSVNEYWPAQLHNDWLETLATFGWIGAGLVWIMLAATLVAPFFKQHSTSPPQFFLFLWLAIAGCLIHARYDFPFQIYSIILLFLTLCAVCSCCSFPRRAGKSPTHVMH